MLTAFLDSLVMMHHIVTEYCREVLSYLHNAVQLKKLDLWVAVSWQFIISFHWSISECFDQISLLILRHGLLWYSSVLQVENVKGSGFCRTRKIYIHFLTWLCDSDWPFLYVENISTYHVSFISNWTFLKTLYIYKL